MCCTGPSSAVSPQGSNRGQQTSEGDHKRLECAPLYNEPPSGSERAHWPGVRFIITVQYCPRTVRRTGQDDELALS